MNQSTSLAIHGIVLSGLTSVCKMMSLSHSQTKESVVKEKGCAALKRVTICLECLFQYFLMRKQKHIRTNFLAFCQSASLLPQGASCGNSLNRNYTAHPVLNGALTFILMCECCMEWNFI